MSRVVHFREQVAIALFAALATCALVESEAKEAAAIAASAPWSAPSSTVVAAEEKDFQSGAVMLDGTLHAPKVDGRIPAVVVFHAASARLAP